MNAIAGQLVSRTPSYVRPAGQVLPGGQRLPTSTMPLNVATPVGQTPSTTVVSSGPPPVGATTSTVAPGATLLERQAGVGLTTLLAPGGGSPVTAHPSYNGVTLPPPITPAPITMPVAPPGPFDNLSWTDAAIGLAVVAAGSLAIVYVVRSRQAHAAAAAGAPAASAAPGTRRTSTTRRASTARSR